MKRDQLRKVKYEDGEYYFHQFINNSKGLIVSIIESEEGKILFCPPKEIMFIT